MTDAFAGARSLDAFKDAFEMSGESVVAAARP
jgi:hypothetical protein